MSEAEIERSNFSKRPYRGTGQLPAYVEGLGEQFRGQSKVGIVLTDGEDCKAHPRHVGAEFSIQGVAVPIQTHQAGVGDLMGDFDLTYQVLHRSEVTLRIQVSSGHV